MAPDTRIFSPLAVSTFKATPDSHFFIDPRRRLSAYWTKVQYTSVMGLR